MKTKITEILIYKCQCIDCGFYEFEHSNTILDEKDCSYCYSENTKIDYLKTIRIENDGLIKQC